MNAAVASIRSYFAGLTEVWDRFWFAPTDPSVLSAIRVFTGASLLWTHFVWSFGLVAFFGAEGWLPVELTERATAERMAICWFDFISAPWLLWTVHIVSLLAFFMLMIGWFSRTAAVVSYFAALNYALHVSPGAFFGLDKINCLLAMYVMLGPCGARYSIDRLLKLRRGDDSEPPTSWSANLAIRLIQTHLCVVYLQGLMWWDGTATWFTVANVEYRTLDMTWMANHLWFAELLTHATVFWELFYCCLIWNRWLRPWMLLTALGVHAFIGIAMGMPEFARAMLIANAAFLAPSFVRAVLDPLAGWVARRLGAKSSS
jgi:hypothetical protein